MQKACTVEEVEYLMDLICREHSIEDEDIDFVVDIYKDMDYADEIEYSNSFKNYKDSLDFYNEQVKESNGEFYVELSMQWTCGGEWDCYSLANNEI